MPIGKNVNLTDKLIKRTVSKANIASKARITSKTSKRSITRKTGKVNITSNTDKMTFYVKKDLLKKLYNFAYWNRHNITEAFNMVLADGLKGKNTKPKE